MQPNQPKTEKEMSPASPADNARPLPPQNIQDQLAAINLPPDHPYSFDQHGNLVALSNWPDPDPTDPDELATMNRVDPSRCKRQAGRTGPTTDLGKGVAAMNSLTHGCCAKTLILKNESQEAYDKLLNSWLVEYGSPVADTPLYCSVVKVAQAEWYRLRNQRQYDFFLSTLEGLEMAFWDADIIKRHDLILRYVTASERKFRADYKILEHHWRIHGKPAAEKAKAKAEPKEERIIAPPPIFINNETGEATDCWGNKRPAPPNWVPKPIIPGEYDQNHPSNWRPPKKGTK